MPHVRVLSVFGRAASLLDGLNHVPASLDRHGPIGTAVEHPDLDTLHIFCIGRIPATANWDRRGERLRTRRNRPEGTEAAHRLSGDVHAIGIERVLFLDDLQQFQGNRQKLLPFQLSEVFRNRPHGCPRHCRSDHEAGVFLPHLGAGQHCGCFGVAAVAVQCEDERILLLPIDFGGCHQPVAEFYPFFGLKLQSLVLRTASRRFDRIGVRPWQ